jgi:hypothetical protein
MIKEKLYFTINSNVLTIYLAGEKYGLLNTYLSSIHNQRIIVKMIEVIENLQISPRMGIEENGIWIEHSSFGNVTLIDENKFVGVYFNGEKIIITDFVNNISTPLYLEISELLILYKKIAFYFKCYEKEEVFKLYPDLLSVINENCKERLLNLGFSFESNSVNHARFNRTDLSLEFTNDRDGVMLFITDNFTKKFYESMLVLTILDWDMANAHKLRMRKYDASLSSLYRDTGTLLVILQYLESHLISILVASKNKSFLEKIEAEHQLKSELLKKIFSLPKDNQIRQLLIKENFQWFDLLGEDFLGEKPPVEANSELIPKDFKHKSFRNVNEKLLIKNIQFTKSELQKMIPPSTEDCDTIHEKYLAWHKLDSEDEEKLLLIGEITQENSSQANQKELVNAMQQYWSKEAPIALDLYPYNICKVYRLKSCSSLYLVYEDYTSQPPEKRCRLIQKRLIVRENS